MKYLHLVPHGLSIFAAIIFLDSLRYKFTNHPNTQEIFGRLDMWAENFGAAGIFSQTGLFSQYTIGGAELVASALLLLGILPKLRRLQGLGALIGIAVMSGAISFHLFTPLTTDPNNDGGALFVMACCVWVSCLVLILWRKEQILAALCGIKTAVLGR